MISSTAARMLTTWDVSWDTRRGVCGGDETFSQEHSRNFTGLISCSDNVQTTVEILSRLSTPNENSKVTGYYDCRF